MAGRDPDNDCEAFHEGAPGDAGLESTCQTDGHYMCDECVFRATCDGGCGKRPNACECRYCDECAERADRCRCPPLHALSHDAFARRMRARRQNAPTIPATPVEAWATPKWARGEWSREYLGEFRSAPEAPEDAPEDTPFTRRMLSPESDPVAFATRALKPPKRSMVMIDVGRIARRIERGSKP